MENNEIVFQRSIEKHELESFLHEINDSFTPKLNETYTISAYAEKLMNYAEFFIACLNNKIIGFIAFYCNDEQKNNAHIPILGIDGKHRGIGLGSKLLQLAIDYVEALNFNTITIETNKGSAAQYIYEKKGFSVIHITKNKINGEEFVMMKLNYE